MAVQTFLDALLHVIVRLLVGQISLGGNAIALIGLRHWCSMR
ncbi:MAG TPA: hypothetical protein VII52_09850 [Gemmatimonadaceae bacterium]